MQDKENIIVVEPDEITDEILVSENGELAMIVETTPEKPTLQKYYLRYLFLPFLFLSVALLGGLRLSDPGSAFVFVRPSLLCLIFATVLLLLFFRAGLISFEGWFSENFPLSKNLANGAVLLSAFAAATQVFNSLIPENGLPYWVVAFCFFWTLWNYLFTEFDTMKLMRSLAGLFGLAFAAKYLLLANLTAPANESWLRSMIEDPAKNAFTYLLDLPSYSAGTGFIQFFVLVLFLLGLYLLPNTTAEKTLTEVRER